RGRRGRDRRPRCGSAGSSAPLLHPARLSARRRRDDRALAPARRAPTDERDHDKQRLARDRRATAEAKRVPMTTARTVWFERAAGGGSPFAVAVVRQAPLGAPGPGEVRVRSICSGVSAGTERLVLRGEVPPEVRALMALPPMRGTFDLPIAYGYAAVGAIEAVGPGVAAGRIGERAFLLHPHQDVLVAAEGDLRPLPER